MTHQTSLHREAFPLNRGIKGVFQSSIINLQFPIIRLTAVCLAAVAVVSCSTKRNTASTRFWHSFTARYNTYYNGTLAYIDASLEKEAGNRDNFTELIPLYTVGNRASRELGKANYDIAITKAEKAIHLHSIKARPEWTKGRRKTERDVEWLSRREYNPFLWRAWMLMGRSQFYKGEFDEAAATFSYMSRLYRGQPAIYGKARAWLAKCYVENGWLYDAEDVIRNMMRDSIDWRAQKEWDYTLCDYYLHTGDLPEAAKYLRRVTGHEMRSRQRAREYFLLGQVEAAQGHDREAYDAFRRVLRQHPSYELRFNAGIAMTEVMARGTDGRRMIGRLRRMARNGNNSEYLDQIYYAMGNIYLAQGDTLNAIGAYEKGNKGAVRAGIEKGVLLLHLGDLYWETERYGDAKRCYGEAIGLLDKDRGDYARMAERSRVLDELVPYTDAIHLQDSLQELSHLPERELLVKIDGIIEDLKRKEREAEREAAQAEIDRRGAYPVPSERRGVSPPSGELEGAAPWYFYSPMAVQQGRLAFERLWGKRENVDDWQRDNKTVVGNGGDGGTGGDGVPDWDSLTDEQRDSIAREEERQEMMAARMDSAVNNPHKREYYLAQIPFSDEQRAESDKIIMESLLRSAVIFKDKLNNLPLSEKAFRRLEEQYPAFEPKDEAYYHLFLLYSRKGDDDRAQAYVERMKAECPESKWTLTVTDPYFYENARYGKHLEDSLYGATYEAFKADRFGEVYNNVETSRQRFPLGDNRDRFLFLYGMSKLGDGDIKSCTESMEAIVRDYPKSSVSEMAGMIINGVKAGRRLYTGNRFDLGDVWNRRTGTLTDADSTAARTFSTGHDGDFLFVLAYAPDSLDENRLLFQLARYNFTSFMVRNFDITIDDAQGMHHMTVSGFRNFGEARQYSRVLLQQEGIRRAAQGARPMVISKENLELIGQRYSYNDYDTFYVNNLAPLSTIRPEQLYEPVTVKTEGAPDVKGDVPQREKTDENGIPVDTDPVKPMLPTEEAAPGGAKPIDPNAEKELEDADAITIPSAPSNSPEGGRTPLLSEGMGEAVETEVDAPVTQDGTEIVIGETEETESTAPAGEEVVVIDEAPAAETGDDSVIIDEAPAAKTDGDSVVIDEAPAAETGDDSVIIVEAPAAETGDDSVIIVDDTPKAQTDAAEEVIILDEGTAPRQRDDRRNGQEADKEIIIIDDTSPQKESMQEIEDEYYELDGF